MANGKRMNAKQKAYAQKQERQGHNVIMWIIGILILLAICYAAWSVWLVS